MFVLLGSAGILQAQKRGYTNHNEVGAITYGPIFLETGFAVRTFHGLQFSDSYSLGLTLGASRYPVEGEHKFWLVPLTVKNRYTLWPQHRASLFTDLDLGYGFGFLNAADERPSRRMEYTGGLAANPQIGLKIKGKESRHFWTIAAGYSYQRFGTKEYLDLQSQQNAMISMPTPSWNDQDLIAIERYNLHRVTLMLGFGF